MTGLLGHIGVYALRLAAVDDLVDKDTLHLLRLVPRAWLVPGKCFGSIRGMRFRCNECC